MFMKNFGRLFENDIRLKLCKFAHKSADRLLHFDRLFILCSKPFQLINFMLSQQKPLNSIHYFKSKEDSPKCPSCLGLNKVAF